MAAIDPTYLHLERNRFPSLTDKEFETLYLYCMTMNIQRVAKLANRTASLVNKHLRSCKLKLKASSDFDLFVLFLQRTLRFEHLFPELTTEEATLLFVFVLLGDRVLMTRFVGLSRKEIYKALFQIKCTLELNDLDSLRWFFVMRVAFY